MSMMISLKRNGCLGFSVNALYKEVLQAIESCNYSVNDIHLLYELA
jgi:hypothetical protein